MNFLALKSILQKAIGYLKAFSRFSKVAFAEKHSTMETIIDLGSIETHLDN